MDPIRALELVQKHSVTWKMSSAAKQKNGENHKLCEITVSLDRCCSGRARTLKRWDAMAQRVEPGWRVMQVWNADPVGGVGVEEQRSCPPWPGQGLWQ
ncbi:Protein of unknown function [Gryllus bimaculatus]|nr:Protein of unknown function [Gryllus bimaculatus]